MIWKNRKTVHDPFDESSILNPFKMKNKNRQHTSTKKAVDKNDLNTKRATANVATVTEILAIGLGTDS